MPSPFHSISPSSRGPRLVALHLNLFLPASSSDDVPGILHPHQGIHIDSERLLESQGHFPGKVGSGVQQTGKGWTGYVKNSRGLGHGKAVSVNDFCPQKAARMDRVQHPHGYQAKSFIIGVLSAPREGFGRWLMLRKSKSLTADSG